MYCFELSGIVCNLTGAADFSLPSGVQCRADSLNPNTFLEFSAETFLQSKDTLELRMEIRNVSSMNLKINALIPGYADSALGGGLRLGGNVQEWTVLAGGNGVGVTDLCDPCYVQKMQDFHARDYALYGNRTTGKYALFGFTSFLKQDSEIILHISNPGFKFSTLAACCKTGGRILAPSEPLASERLLIRIGNNPAAMMNEYAETLAKRLACAQNMKDIAGWSTWDFYQDEVTESDLLENVSWLAAHRKTLPVEYIQIDEGFELREGDWLKTNRKFPHGLKYISDRIHEAGFKPGLWLCPFLAAARSEVAIAHPDWILKDACGRPLVLSGYAEKEVFGLDCSIPEVSNYLRELGHIVTYDCGFDYLKLDGANQQVLSDQGVLSDPSVSRGEAMARGLAAFRSGMKPGSFLLCAAAFGISMGITDGMRIGEDAGGRWDASKIDKNHGERDRFNGPGELRRAVAAVCNHWYLHKKLWVNDPDYLVVRQAGLNSELSYEEARTWASVVAMSNGSVILSDPMARLLPERVGLLEKILPHSQSPARPVDFFRKNIPSILAMEASNASEKWLVAAVLNPDRPERVRNYELNFAELGLEKDTDYLVFEFWNSRFYGTARNHFTVEELAPRDCRVFSFRKKTGAVQLAGTDSHISMGALEIERCDGFVLTARPRGRDWKAFFFVPGGAAVPSGLEKLSDGLYVKEIKAAQKE